MRLVADQKVSQKKKKKKKLWGGGVFFLGVNIGGDPTQEERVLEIV